MLKTLIPLTAFLVAAGGLAAPADAAAPGGANCLWAGGAHAQNTQVTAGGWTFSCQTDVGGAPRWARGHAVNQRSTVPNPGADNSPASQFSPGALQPGTTDGYCVGNQFVDGVGSVFESAPDGRGGFSWVTAGPVELWNVKTSSSMTTSSSGTCNEGELV